MRTDLILRALFDLAQEWPEADYISWGGLLNRLGFAPTPEEIEDVLSHGWVEQVQGFKHFRVTLELEGIRASA